MKMETDCKTAVDLAMNEFKNVRRRPRIGHARFRRAPVAPPLPPPPPPSIDHGVNFEKNANLFSQVASSGKSPLSSSIRKCASSENVLSGKCHCSKRRKQRVKTVIRVPAMGAQILDIPPDKHSWRKYGQKLIKGSPYPRGNYKCSSVKGCPARKHVERALDEPTMLVVSYEGDHNHSLSNSQTNSLILDFS